jgi:hypothetical protein
MGGSWEVMSGFVGKMKLDVLELLTIRGKLGIQVLVGLFYHVNHVDLFYRENHAKQ